MPSLGVDPKRADQLRPQHDVSSGEAAAAAASRPDLSDVHDCGGLLLLPRGGWLRRRSVALHQGKSRISVRLRRLSRGTERRHRTRRTSNPIEKLTAAALLAVAAVALPAAPASADWTRVVKPHGDFHVKRGVVVTQSSLLNALRRGLSTARPSEAAEQALGIVRSPPQSLLRTGAVPDRRRVAERAEMN